MSGTFELDIARFVAKAKGDVTLVVRRVSLDIFSRVIMKTPVDSGRAKGNWLVAIGSIPAGTIEVFDKSPLGDVGTVAISKVDAILLGLKAGDIIYLVNNLPYARALEFGHSKQAPAGMVRLSVLEFPQVVAKAVAEVPK